MALMELCNLDPKVDGIGSRRDRTSLEDTQFRPVRKLVVGPTKGFEVEDGHTELCVHVRQALSRDNLDITLMLVQRQLFCQF